MRSALARLSVLTFVVCLLSSCMPHDTGETPAQKRSYILHMRSETLARLYRIHPAAQAEIRGADGYAVFSNIGVNIILVSAGGGTGVAHDNHTGRDIFMRMVSGGIGPGLGAKDFRGVFVFHTRKAFDQFIDRGWVATAQADAAAKAGSKGGAIAGAVTVSPGVDLYQMTGNGLALQATIQGTKYFRDKELNSK